MVLASVLLWVVPAQVDARAPAPAERSEEAHLEELEPPPAVPPSNATAQDTRVKPSRAVRLLPALLAAVAGMGGAAVGVVAGALAGALVPAALFTGFMALLSTRERTRDNVFPPSPFLLDVLLYGLLFALAGSPVVLAAAGAGDAAGFAVGAALGARGDTRRTLLAFALGALVAVPAALAWLVGTAALALWLGASSLPDVLMFPAFAGLVLSVVLLVAGALLVRPVLHGALLVADALLR